MLESMRRGQRWLTAIFVGVIGLVFAAFLGLGAPFQPGGGGSATAVVELDGVQLGIFDFERIRQQQENRYREALGDQFDSKTARNFLDSQSLRILVDSAVLAQAAEELGLRVSKLEIQRTVRGFEGFRDEAGRFDQDEFIAQVEYEYGSQRNFMRVIREDLLKQKLGRLLTEQARVSEAEAMSAARAQLEQVRIAYVLLDPGRLPAGEQIDDEAAQAYLDAHRGEVEAVYEERRSEFAIPEKVHVRHLVIGVDQAAFDPAEAEESARQKAEEARTRIVEGASFADVAMEVSDDSSSRGRGGDLGFLSRDEMDDALAEVAFSIEEGTVSEVVRSDSGFHVVRIEGREAAGEQPFDEVALDLARGRAASERAAERVREHTQALAEAIGGGASLEEAARERELTLERTDWLRRRADGFITGLGASPELMAAAFTLTPEASSSARVFEIGEKRAMVQLLERDAVDERELLSTADELQAQMLEARRNTLIQEWIDARRSQLADDGRLFVNADLVMGR